MSDLNGDNNTDLVTANNASANVSVLLGNGNGTFQAQQTFAVGTYPTFVAASDLSDDHKPDLVTANSGSSGTVSVLFNLSGPFAPSTFFDWNTPQQQIRLKFGQNVSASLSTSDLILQNLTTGQTVPTANLHLSYDLPTNTATFTFPGYSSGMLPDGNYRATLPAASVTDTQGNPMTADSVFDFFVLAADANHDRIVDVTDLGILATNWQGTGKTFSQGDFNYDGKVDVTDLGILATNWQKSLAATAPAIVAQRVTARPASSFTAASRPITAPLAGDPARSRHSLLEDVGLA